jgi:hypothetical protein
MTNQAILALNIVYRYWIYEEIQKKKEERKELFLEWIENRVKVMNYRKLEDFYWGGNYDTEDLFIIKVREELKQMDLQVVGICSKCKSNVLRVNVFFFDDHSIFDVFWQCENTKCGFIPYRSKMYLDK